MRLTCPNCDAQYVVPAAAIPADGRDVQCSNCGHIWFTKRETDDAALARGAAPQPNSDETDSPTEPRRAPPQKALREEVKSVLQQEAKRELMARQSEAKPSFVVQEELGLLGAIDAADVETTPPARPERPESAKPETHTEAAPKTRWGFHLGFWTAILLLALAVCLYIYADDIRTRMPQLSEFLDSYVPWVDGIRDWLTNTAATAENWFRENFNGFQKANE